VSAIERNILNGIGRRCNITDCPLGAFKVEVNFCSGRGECADVCVVNVFERNERGECTVVNDALCFGCMACVAQCQENGVAVVPTKPEQYLTLEEVLR
jgi:NAD-dependent dihydropyrimidine dehydrogenase PreA subunit